MLSSNRGRLLVFIGLVAAGGAGFGWLQISGDPPRRRNPNDRGRAVRVIEVKPLEVVPRVTGYGVVQAQRSWQAVAEVGGTLVEIADNLEVGRTVQKGTRLFKIDPGNYELERNRGEASVRGVRAQIAEIKTREESARSSLALEKKILELAIKDLERAKKAQEAGLGPQTAVEQAERGVLTAQKSVQALENTLLELPASRRVLEAQIAQQEAGVAGARKDIARTEVVAPFTMRIREVNASLHQAVGSGQVVVVGDGVDVMEVAAHMPIGTVGPLMGPRDTASPPPSPAPDPTEAPKPLELTPDGSGGDAPLAGSAVPAGSAAPTVEDGATPAPATPGPSRASRISATISLKSQDVEVSWEGKFRRFQGVDPTTRTVGVVVEVTDPRRRQGRTGPPLSAGMHVEVELKGVPRADCLAIPRSALFDTKVYVAGAEDRLEIRDVEIDILQEQFVCVAKGLAPGDRVVLTALAPAVEGMLLAPRNDETAAVWLGAVAKGEKPPELTAAPEGPRRPRDGKGKPPDAQPGPTQSAQGPRGQRRGEGRGATP